MPKYPKSEAIRSAEVNQETGFISWNPADPASRELAIRESAKAINEYTGFSRGTERAVAFDSRFRDFSNILPGISSRPELTRQAFNAFRPAEASPTAYREIIMRCSAIYEHVGLIKNIIDLMGDFAGQGVRLVHPNKKIEKFYQNWFTKVNGVERSERFLNYLYRTGNIVIRKQTAKVNVKTIDKIYKAQADADFNSQDLEPSFKYEKKEIPWKYTFIDASTVTIVGGPLASFAGKPLYALMLPTGLRRQILSPKNDAEREIVNQLPPDLIAAAKTNKPYILPPDKTLVYHYKKDDWNGWAVPMIYSIFKDVVLLDKLKLADSAALDGVISNVRIFRLGDIEHNILPSPYAAQKLNDILQSNVGGGTLDIIWGKDIDIIETKSDIYNILGKEKYDPHLNNIYAGLGIPPTLTGTFGAGGTTNNFISLKTLTERLEYGRAILTSFWESECELIRAAMGFRFSAKVEYDIMNLGNEDAVKKLYLDLADRNIISDETIQRIFKQDSDMERTRINREARDRDNGRMVNKTGPYFEPAAGESLKKIALQQGTISPKQAGVDVPDLEEGDKPLVHIKHEQDVEKQKLSDQAKIAQQKAKGPSGQGRPKNVKDSRKRKTKTYSPRGKAGLIAWASRAQATIADFVNPGLLSLYGKKNLRQLSTAEAEEAERIKFGVLCNIEPLDKIDEDAIQEALGKGIPQEASAMLKSYLDTFKETGSPTMEDIKNIQSCVYVDYHVNEVIDDNV